MLFFGGSFLKKIAVFFKKLPTPIRYFHYSLMVERVIFYIKTYEDRLENYSFRRQRVKTLSFQKFQKCHFLEVAF